MTARILPTRSRNAGLRAGLRLATFTALAALLAYAAVITLLWWKQEALLFQPQPLPADYRFNAGADVHESWVEVPDARLRQEQ